MELLERAIIQKGKVLPGDVLKVGSFFNQQLDVSLLNELAKDIHNHFAHKNVTKILTVEASGIALAVLTAQYFGCNVIYAKKSRSSNVDGNVYTARCFSYTHNVENTLVLPSDYICKEDNVLVLDDFLARGEAVNAMLNLVGQAGATLQGVAVGIEKGFQGGGDALRAKGIDLYSLAIIDSMSDTSLTFRK